MMSEVICSYYKRCREREECGGAKPHEECSECGHCKLHKDAKCEKVEVLKD